MVSAAAAAAAAAALGRHGYTIAVRAVRRAGEPPLPPAANSA